jgi:hypothetical protein
MRNLVCSVAAIAALALVACGASSKEVAMAKTARYQGDKLELFAATRAAVESANYKIARSDETRLDLATTARWFSVEGLSQTPRSEGSEMLDLTDKSINISMVVALLHDGDNWVVKVTPVLARYNRGIPKLEPLKEGDASLPGWVESKVDSLALDIHKALGKYEVKSVPGQAPPPTEGPSGPPGETPPAEPAPAEGSAAAPAP